MGKGKKAGKRLTKKELVQKLADLFQSNPKESFPVKTIFRKLELNTHPLKMLCMDILYDLIDENALFQPEANVFQLKPFTYQRTEKEEAIDLERDTFVGVLQVAKSYAFVETDRKILSHDIFISKNLLHNGKDGDKVVARILEWPEDAKNPRGEVVAVLGKKGDNTTEMHAILAEYGLPYSYPEEIEAAANLIPEEIPEQERALREDFREVPTFTIDPRDAKDFDDALSVRKAGNLWEVGVHIADVTYYVKERSAIDNEAFNRATSIYLVDRTIPMLPERLCNKLCSLRQDEEKVAYSVIFLMNEEAKVQDFRIVHTLIKSNRRFVYEEVQDILEQNGVAEQYDEGRPRPEKHTHDEYISGKLHPRGEWARECIILDKLAKKLREARFKAGGINFDHAEVRFEIDEKGKPLSVYFKTSKDANKLVEEFMLLANRTVAEYMGKTAKNRKAKTFVYRIHDLPDPENLDHFKQFISRFGYKVNTSGTKTEVSKSINSLLRKASGTPEQNLIETVSLKAMQKAKYSTHNIGHYGLCFDYYTHFTSPIRRYPDMMVHRLLTRYIDQKGRSASEAKFEECCEHCSAMEQTAAAAERSSVKYKQVEYMQDHLGQIFPGTVSGVKDWGLFVELDENKCEGFVPARSLGDEYFEYDEPNYCLFGRQSGLTFRIGDPIKVKVVRADLDKKQLDFAWVGSEQDSPRKAGTHTKKSRKSAGRRKKS